MCYSGGRGIFQNQPQLCMTSSVFSTTKCKDVPHFKASRQHVRNCGQRVVLGTQTINDFVPQLNGNKVVFIFCIVSRSLNTNFGPRRWNSTFPRRVNKKCQEETCTFKGKATGKGLWVGFCAMAALCQGLLPSPEPPVPKHPKKKMRPFCQSVKVDTTAAAAEWLKILPLCLDLWALFNYVSRKTQKNKLHQYSDKVNNAL